MRSLTSIIAILLIVLGITGFGYKYITYRSTENIAQIGDVKLTAEQDKAIFISPILSGICLVGGIVLLVVAVSNRKS